MYLSSGNTSTIVRLKGVDSSRFLQGQLTCDVARLADGQWTWAAACSPKGRVIDVFKLYRQHQDDYLLLCWSDDASTRLLAHLSKYKVFFKCEFETDTGSQCVGILSRQENIRATLALSPAWQVLTTHSQVLQDVKLGARQSLSRCIDTDQLHWAELIINSKGQSTDPRAVSTLAALRGRFKSSRQEDYLWHAGMLALGIPRLCTEHSGSFTAHALGLPSLGAVSFTKGCFTGQEIVARTQYLGSAKKFPVALAEVDEAYMDNVAIGRERFFASRESLDSFVEERGAKMINHCDIPRALEAPASDPTDSSVKSLFSSFHRICVALLDPEKI